MIEIATIFVVSLIVIYVDWRMTSHNCNMNGNGLGSVVFVNSGKAFLPAQYRVLVPWLTHYIDYYYLRWIAIGSSIVCAWLYFGTVMTMPILGVLLLALYFVWASVFDYTDGYVEVALFALSFYLAATTPLNFFMLFVGLMAGLNRETSVFIPICLVLDGYWGAGVITTIGIVIGITIPRVMYPDAKRYCSFWQLPVNIKRMCADYKRDLHPLHHEWTNFFVLTAVLIAVYIAGPLTGVHVGMAIMFCLLLIPTIWGEIRVFAPVVLFAIPLIGNAL